MTGPADLNCQTLPGLRQRPTKPTKAPTLREERRLLRSGHTLVAAIDEVGRGALAGPVTVGVVVVDAATPSAPAGVRDSKLLSPQARRALAPRLRRWAPMYAVGHASALEIDRIGIIAALRLAACRALGTLPVRPDCALLDGSHNWLSLPASALTPDDPALFELDAPPGSPVAGPAGSPSLNFLPLGSPAPDVPEVRVLDLAALEDAVGAVPRAAVRTGSLPEVRAELVPGTVVTQVKADLRCAAVAAASVLAKVERDSIMIELATRYPEYGWALNKGYSAPEHITALRRFGPSDLHRVSWNLPGVGDPFDPSDFPGLVELDLTDGTQSPAL